VEFDKSASSTEEFSIDFNNVCMVPFGHGNGMKT
jgi:hypothetical protein